jgi:uncharacterized membrane protein
MQGVVDYLKSWQLHPVVDHFTVSLILTGIVIDLVASLFSGRLWLRYTAATLMVLGAIAALGSNLTGGWEADRIWDKVTGPAKEVLERHAEIGEILPWVAVGLAVWRVGLQSLGFLARTRFIYLIAAIVGGGAILYQGSLGGDLVYDYGVGTAALNTEPQAPSSLATAVAPVTTESPSAIPTVYVPPPTPAAAPSPVPSSAPTVPVPAVSEPMPAPGSSKAGPSTSPAAVPSETVVNPPPGAAPSTEGSLPNSKPTTL